MSGIKLSFFRHLGSGLFDEAGIKVGEYRASYNDEEGEHELRLQNTLTSSQVYVTDDRGWNIVEDGMDVQVQVYIDNPAALFGQGGIVTEDALVSVAAICQSLHSNRTEATWICDIDESSQSIQNEGVISFKKGEFRDSVTVRIVLYLKHVGERKAGYADRSGTILGELDAITFVFDDQSQLFPIVEEENESKPLWWVTCKWSDMLDDTFTKENVAIHLNRSNENYPRLNPDTNQFDPAFFAEVMSSALTIIIEYAKTQQEWADVKSNDNLVRGTIGSVLSYMINTLGWDDSTLECESESIRMYMYSESERR